MNEFCGKWTSARVFRDTFDLLVSALPLTEYGDPNQYWSLPQSAVLKLQGFIEKLEDLKVQQKVISTLSMMCQGSRPLHSKPTVEETLWIQYEHRGGDH